MATATSTIAMSRFHHMGNLPRREMYHMANLPCGLLPRRQLATW
jgi:hypothetical protein